MKTFQLILDSRTRTSNNVYNATFQLTKPISRVTKVRVKHVQFANTLYNIGDGENTLVLSTGTLIIPPGFYTPTELVALLQTICVVTYNTGKLNWALGVDSNYDIERDIGPNTQHYLYRDVHDTIIFSIPNEYRFY